MTSCNQQRPLQPEYSSQTEKCTDGSEASVCEDKSQYVLVDGDLDEETVITSIRAANLATGLRRLPAGFYATIYHSGREWRTENKPVSVSTDVVEWAGPVPIPSDLSATVCLRVYASFEFRPVLGDGEQLCMLAVTVERLLEHSAKHVSFAFLPDDEGDVVSPCSSLLVTVKRQKHRGNSSSTSEFYRRSATGSLTDLEDATNQGHSALLSYRKYGKEQDLECSVEHYGRALDMCPLDHPCRAAAQSNMAMAKYLRSWVDDTDLYLDAPLILYRSALAARPTGHTDRPLTLIQLASVHLGRFEIWQDEIDAAEAEALLHEVVDLSPADSHENRIAILLLQLHVGYEIGPNQADDQSSAEEDLIERTADEDPWGFSLNLLRRFNQSRDLEDLQRAISLLEAFVWSTSDNDGHCAGLGVLGMAFLYRFRHFGESNDLSKAVSRLGSAVELTPDDHPVKPARLNELGNAFRDRYEHVQKLDDLEQAISKHRAAVDLTPDGHPDKPGRLGNLANTFYTRFLRLGNPEDLKEAILRHKDAIDLTPDHHPDKPRRLNNLANSFVVRFRRFGELGDIEQAISIHMDAADLIPDGHPDKPSQLINLASSFQARFRRLGKLDDLEQAISRYRDAAELIPHGHVAKPGCLSNLGNAFRLRFERLGELKDLEQAISKQRAAVDLVPDGHSTRQTVLMNLGVSLAVRFKRLGELHDLEQMLSMHKEVVDLTPDRHPAKPGCLNNLGNAFQIRFDTFGEPDDLEQAISRHSEGVGLAPDDHPEKSMYLNDLANSFLARFECLGELSDLDQALVRYTDSLRLTPDGHPRKSHALSNLGNSYLVRFNRFGDLQDLEQAISTFKDAVDMAPDGHPNKPSLLVHLGNALGTRWMYFGKLSDLEEAISMYSLAASASSGRTTIRFHASELWIIGARILKHHSLLDAYSVAIGLLPQLAWIGLSLNHRYRELLRGADIAREAAAAALDAGLPETAVEWLEQGRSIIWGELFQLRSSYKELSSVYPNHAQKLQQLSTELEQASTIREKSLSSLSEQSQNVESLAMRPLEEEADRHRMVAIERDKLLEEIRRLPGFERFLLKKEFSQLRASAHSGPVVILNAVESRCDALIIVAEAEGVIHVPLPNFTLKRSIDLQNTFKSFLRCTREGKIAMLDDVGWEPFLSPLWKCVVKPVLDALGFSTPGDLSRIFWCPTGPFAFLPIHAAGFHDTVYSQPGHKVFDFVVSSYVPTLSVLLPPPNPLVAPTGDLRLLVVCQPPTDGLSPLPGVLIESEYIKAAARDSPSARTTILESVGTVEEVISLMKEADWAHFACHGIQDGVGSGLCLADRRRLKLSDIIGLSRPRGGLAFLSACQTAMGDKDLSDEAIHIAAGMLFAGYGGVVGTMWSISDRLAPDLARDVYEQLFGNGTRPDYRGAARALHDAVGRLRDDLNAPFVEWLPFIHVGL